MGKYTLKFIHLQVVLTFCSYQPQLTEWILFFTVNHVTTFAGTDMSTAERKIILSGSFHPLHDGHLKLLEVAARYVNNYLVALWNVCSLWNCLIDLSPFGHLVSRKLCMHSCFRKVNLSTSIVLYCPFLPLYVDVALCLSPMPIENLYEMLLIIFTYFYAAFVVTRIHALKYLQSTQTNHH